MFIAREPSASRGEVTLQPGYFSSSLYVQPLREDISALISSFADQLDGNLHPFDLFKTLWSQQGWSWLHLQVYDGRARQSFICITERLFAERIADTESPLTRVVGLFSLYTFHTTQPCTSAPPFYSTTNIAIPIDIYESIVSLPNALRENHLLRLRPYVTHILTTLLDAQAFLILPDSSLRAQNPARLPREIFVPEGQDATLCLKAFGGADLNDEVSAATHAKKKGRPSKRDKARKAKDALASLERYVDRNAVTLPEQYSHHSLGPAYTSNTHMVLGQAPHTSLKNYVDRKNELLASIYTHVPDDASSLGPSQLGPTDAVWRANEAVLMRLKHIDAMAAEQGLEVGGEGGEKTGLCRVEKAVKELQESSGIGASGGILGLLEGAGMDFTVSLQKSALLQREIGLENLDKLGARLPFADSND